MPTEQQLSNCLKLLEAHIGTQPPMMRNRCREVVKTTLSALGDIDEERFGKWLGEAVSGTMFPCGFVLKTVQQEAMKGTFDLDPNKKKPVKVGEHYLNEEHFMEGLRKRGFEFSENDDEPWILLRAEEMFLNRMVTVKGLSIKQAAENLRVLNTSWSRRVGQLGLPKTPESFMQVMFKSKHVIELMTKEEAEESYRQIKEELRWLDDIYIPEE